MPYAVLFAKPEVEGIVEWLAPQLPDIIAPALSLQDRELHEGKLTPGEIMVIPLLGTNTVNGKDIELVILAHNFPERVENIEKRKEQILIGIRALLAHNVVDTTVAVCIVSAAMAYGEFKLPKF